MVLKKGVGHWRPRKSNFIIHVIIEFVTFQGPDQKQKKRNGDDARAAAFNDTPRGCCKRELGTGVLKSPPVYYKL